MQQQQTYYFLDRDSHQDFGDWEHWLLFFGYNTNVEDSREDEDETRGRCGTWKMNKKHKIEVWQCYSNNMKMSQKTSNIVQNRFVLLPEMYIS